MNIRGLKKAYTMPQLVVFGPVEQLTQDPKQTDFSDMFKGEEGEGLPPGKVPGTHDAFTADSMS